MAKTKITKSILKTAAVGFACIMCGAFFPANAMASAEEITPANVNSISVNTGNEASKQQSLTVKKGETVVIPAATYKYDAGSITIGEKDEGAKITSEVIVTEKSTGDEVVVSGGKFVAEKVGQYVVTYKVVHDTVEYSYDLIVTAQATNASFDFETNVENVIPSIYDITLADGKDVVLPLPTVMGEKEEVLLENDKENFITGAASATTDTYVKIKITCGADEINAETKTVNGKEVYVIPAATLSAGEEGDRTYDGKTIKVLYSFYQKVDDKSVYVASTSKSFIVKEKYYFADSEKKDSEYELVASFSSNTFPDSATVGVAKTLPGAIGTTKATNSPATEGVETYYTIQVIKADGNGKYNTADAKDVTAEVISDGNKFTAKEEGSYKFIYTVKDFYGHTAINTDEVTRIIQNVKDSKSASVFIYDAAKPGYDAEAKTYASAENLLKTKAINRNIIMYAIGGTDNMVANEDITLRREIRNYSGIKEFVITESLYDNYNLIFAPDALSGSTITDIYKQVIEDNYALRSALELNDIVTDPLDPEYDINEIKDYMQQYYLVVTTEFNKDAFGNKIVDTEGFSEDTEDAIEQMMAQGYAYIAPAEGRMGTFKNQSYNFYYFANDGINTESSAKKDIELIADYSDPEVPTLTFSSDLQASYLATDTFKFNVASATDNQDSRIKAVTAYRYLKDDAKTAIVSSVTTSTIDYYAGSKIGKAEGKWYNKALQRVTSEGWFVDESASEYTVDLASKPAEAAFVEIFAYAIDDNGNVGFFNKLVAIADATDIDMPVLKTIKNAPSASYSAPDEIQLPSLTFTDAKANYVTAKIAVYKIARDADKKEVSRTPVTSYGMNTKLDSYRGSYIVNGGYFRASVGGEYQVAITVVDAANHSVTSYFTYKVNASASAELKPTIDNISSREETVTPGQMVYLTPPSISMNKEEGFDYIGLGADDETNTATWYNVEAISATDNDYKILDNLYFTAGTEGTYKLQYTAYLIRYATSALTATGEKLVVEEGKLYYNDGSESYLIYLDAENDYALAVEGKDTVPAFVNSNVKGFEVESESVVTIKVSGASLSINDNEMNLHYNEKTEFAVYEADKAETHLNKIEIVKPSTTAIGTSSIDAENTTVTITRNSTTLATIKLSEWQNTEDIDLKDYFEIVGNKIYLKFVKDGKYTISYNVSAMVGEGDTYSVSLSAGDTIAPELEIGSDIVKTNYKVGDPLHIAFSNTTVDESILSVTDKVTKVDALLSSLVVKIKYEDEAYKTLDNEATEEGYYDYSHELKQKGVYTLSFTVTDAAGNTTTKTTKFEVGADEASSVDAGDVFGGIAIGLSVAFLAGVVVYFVVNKKKLDKKEKAYRKEARRK
ncbi:MAG: hypothetical protein E7379_02855 [Clostridiales bacterium]|nr:hypothetical protein [Oscillospiraceae bacterium]MBE7074009.1 hypothetical protein [Clostridiales bacterium]